MPSIDANVKTAIDAANGRKAKIKTMKTEPEGTKGKKLDPQIAKVMIESFPKAKLKPVQVHFGGNAKEVAKEMGAKAFTCGNDIYFAKPGDAKNPKLIAHELAHVLQQGKGKMPKKQQGKALTSK